LFHLSLTVKEGLAALRKKRRRKMPGAIVEEEKSQIESIKEQLKLEVRLFFSFPPSDFVSDLLLSSNLIMVSGGNRRTMMLLWRM